MVRVLKYICDVDGFAIKCDAASDRLPVLLQAMFPHKIVHIRWVAVSCYVPVSLSFLTLDPCHVRFAEPCSRLDQGVEHRLQIKGRSADHLEHVGGGGLLL